MKREKLVEMKNGYFASMQAFFAEHEGTDLEDAEGLWGFLAVSALHHACCQELLVIDYPIMPVGVKKRLLDLEIVLEQIGHDFPSAEHRITAVADALEEIALNGGAS